MRRQKRSLHSAPSALRSTTEDKVSRSSSGLERAAGDGDAVHQAALAVIVVGGVVPGGAVVPKGDGAFAPAEAAGEFGPGGVTVEMLEQRPAVLGRPVLEAQREG